MLSEKNCTFAEINYSDSAMERIYVDTSVFGGCFETEFEQWTKPFIDKCVVGQTNIADCRHIAIATLNNGNILASWYFKHIVYVKNHQRVQLR